MIKYYHHNQPFILESGSQLPQLTIAYHTYGKLNAQHSNVIWVCHALTANSDVADWWPHTVEKNGFLDPEKYFIVCCNCLGSHYGTTGPLSVNPTTGEPWYGSFPLITMRDMVRVQQCLAKYLGISRVLLLVGGSMGGYECAEWGIMEPDFAERIALIASVPKVSPWFIAQSESQRMAIECDPTFGEPSPEAGLRGMEVARSIAMLGFRGRMAFNVSQQDEPQSDALFEHRAMSYQRYQAAKFGKRFNAYSLYRLQQAVDSHNVGRGRGGVSAALRQIRAKCLVVVVSTDPICPPDEQEPYLTNLADVEYHIIHSDFGHDGFLIETAQINTIVKDFMAREDVKDTVLKVVNN